MPNQSTLNQALAVKFCGLTTAQDIKTACDLGVSAIGLVFYPPSPRYVDIQTAKKLAQAVPAFTAIVALVVNMAQAELENLAKEVAFDIVQFHGDETASECQSLANAVNKRWIKAIRVKADDTEQSILNQINGLAHCGACGVILDTFSTTAYGGTGHSFDWTKIPNNSPLPIYLAGGLTPENIGEIVNNLELKNKIAGVDVSGGIEKEKGVKCEIKMNEFIQKLREKN